MGDAAVIAEMFRYPSPGRAGELAAMIDRVSDPAITEALAAFVGTVTELELGEWEELHTRTLDLSPAVVPYVGHVVWVRTTPAASSWRSWCERCEQPR